MATSGFAASHDMPTSEHAKRVKPIVAIRAHCCFRLARAGIHHSLARQHLEDFQCGGGFRAIQTTLALGLLLRCA
jgi:hypothetical protein